MATEKNTERSVSRRAFAADEYLGLRTLVTSL